MIQKHTSNTQTTKNSLAKIKLAKNISDHYNKVKVKSRPGRLKTKPARSKPKSKSWQQLPLTCQVLF